MAVSFHWLKIRIREFQFYKIGPSNILTENIIDVKVGLHLSESKIERGPVFGMIKNHVHKCTVKVSFIYSFDPN